MNNYIVATIKDWNLFEYKRIISTLSGQWHLISKKEELTLPFLKKIDPRYIFFPHWSWVVPKEITDNFECVGFHMTDVPYGRGGSPLQNLIQRGHKKTKLTALRMVEKPDAGPVYLKKDLSLDGTAQEIFQRAAVGSFELIKEIVTSKPEPIEQVGEVTVFKRRKPSESVLQKSGSVDAVYNFIRMLDADTYPKAFINHGDFKIELHSAELTLDNCIEARVKISKREK